MRTTLPPEAKKYLIEAFGKDPNAGIAYSTEPMTFGGSSIQGGGGAERGKKGEATGVPGASEILFGDTEKDDLGLKTAAGAYAIGKGADTFANVLDKFGAQGLGRLLGAAKWLPRGGDGGFLKDAISAIGGGALSAIPGVASKGLRQIADISGANWFDANIGRIGASANELAAQGAGKPWTPFALPQTARTKVTPYDPDYDAKRKLKALQDTIAMGRLNKQYNKLRQGGHIP